MSRYIIIGAGAIGAVLAAQLQDAGIAHVLVGRGENIETIAKHGLSFLHRGVERTVRVNTAASTEQVSLTADDVLVAATKVQDLEEALRIWAWQPVAFPERVGTAAELPLVTLQNGLAADQIALRRFGQVIGGTILTPAQHLRPGQVKVGTVDAIGVVTLGNYPSGSDEVVEQVAADWRKANYLVQVSEQVKRWKAAKIIYSVRNGLEVLTGSPQAIADLGERLSAEATAVLNAAGLTPADSATERDQDLSRFKIDKEHGVTPGQQSTWQSFSRGASSEVDYLNGEIVLLGRLHEVPTPFNIALQHVLGEAALAKAQPGSRHVDEVFTRAVQAGLVAPANQNGGAA